VRPLAAVILVLLAGCSPAAPGPDGAAEEPNPKVSATGPSRAGTGSSPTSEPQASAPGTAPPAWLGQRVLPVRADGFGEIRSTPPALRIRRFTLPDTLPPLPGNGFLARVTPVPPEVLARSTWEPGCPVDDSELTWVRLTFWGFDDRRHTGELLVNSTAADDVVAVFRTLYDARFPFEELRITRSDELDAPPTGDGNTTGAFVCRPAVGSTSYSQHAYGLAIDVNPFQNPYVKDDLVLPELASAYLDRERVRAGMVRPDDAVVRAFASVGWEWGGDWHSLKDYQHFSSNGR
jgi:hypothetical protein